MPHPRLARAGPVAEFLLLAAIWGGSFLCMRIAAPVLGPVPVALLRCAIGAATLLMVFLPMGVLPDLKRRAVPLLVVGAINSALPFVLLGYASLSLTSGTTSIINSLAPLWAAVIAFTWTGDRLTRLQVIGLACGVAGVGILVSGSSALPSTAGIDTASLSLAFGAAIAATAAYGVGANYTRRYLTGTRPMAIAAGSQAGATLVLLAPGIASWPVDTPVNATVWLAILVLGVVCTGLAYLLYFRLVGSVGATRAVSVTFVIPVFGIALGALLLGESINATTVAGAAIIVVGTALTTRYARSSR